MFQKLLLFIFILGLAYVHSYVFKKEPHGVKSIVHVAKQNRELKTKPTGMKKRFDDSLIALAKSKLGSPYVHAKAGPDSFDCSGYTYYLFKEHNVTLPRTSLAQSTIGKKLNRQEIQRGDLLFFDTSSKGHVNHSGVYLGNSEFIHASSGKAYSVTISSLDGWYKDKFLWGIRQ